jgi:hypothetical protein
MIKRNYRRARKGGRNENAQIATVFQDSLEMAFPKEVYSAHGLLMGVQLRARSGFTLDGRGMRGRQRK